MRHCVKCDRVAVDQVPVIHKETGAEPWLWFCDEHRKLAMAEYEKARLTTLN
jgi:hypothetical protein